MAIIRSTLFAIIFYAGSLVAVLLALPMALGGSPALRRHAIHWVIFHRWCARYLLGITSRIEGTIPKGPMLVACKHQSMYETIEMLLILNEPAVVLKHELARIPGWGWAAKRYGVIPIDRGGSAGALRLMLKAAHAAIAEGRDILIFPEGTRVPPGETPPLRAGFAGLYKALKLPVTPVAMDSGRLWARNAFIKRAGVVTFRFGDPIPPGLPRTEAEARVHAAINLLEAPSG